MSKVGSAFGGKGGKKPSTAEIFFTLAAAQKEKEKLSKLGLTIGGDPSLGKFNQARLKKAARLKGGRVGIPSEEEQDQIIKRPGARSAKLLGN